MKFKVKLINIGRDDVNQEYEQEAEDLEEIANLTYVKCKRFLLSKCITLEPDEDDEDSWTLFAGFRNVGKVIIKEMK